MTATVDVVINAQDNASSVLGNLGNIISGIESAINLVGQAFDVAVGAITPFINSASDSEQAIARLEGVLRATGGAAGVSSEELQEWAAQLQNTTRYSDEAIMSSEAVFLTFRNIGEDILPRAIVAATDMAEVFGSLDSATMQLGKALQDPVAMMGALSRAGITFTEAQKEMIKNFVETGDVAAAQNIILSEVEAQVGGLGQTMGLTFAGQVEILKNKFDEVRETIGGAFLPILQTLMTRITDHLPAIEDFGKELAAWVAEFAQSGQIEAFADKVLEVVDNLLLLGSTFLEAGANSSEFRDVLSYLFPEAAEFDFRTWVDGIVEQLSTFLSSVDWEPLARIVADFISGAVLIAMEGLDILVNQVNWTPLGNALSAAASEIFAGMFSSEAGAELDRRLNEFFNEFFRVDEIQGAWAQIGEDIVAGLSAGLSFENMRNNITTLINNIVGYFKQLLGISSPSTVFAQIGQDIIAGLMGGFASMVTPLIGLINNVVSAILDPFDPILELLGLSTGGTGTTGSHTTTPTSPTSPTSPTGSGSVVNQYFAGATINVGSWDEIAYDCIYPNPFIAATGGQLGTSSGGGTGAPR